MSKFGAERDLYFKTKIAIAKGKLADEKKRSEPDLELIEILEEYIKTLIRRWQMGNFSYYGWTRPK